MEAKWDQEGLAAKTTWADKKQKVYDFPSYFFQQWVEDVPEWFVGASKGAIAPSTNNGAESCIKNTRVDAGNVVGSVGETLSFLLSQVESVSQNLFDPSSRQIDASLWRRAAAFSTLFNAEQVRSVSHESQTFYCCSPRRDHDDENVCDREVMSTSHAASMVQAAARQKNGGHTTVEKLLQFNGPLGARVFLI